MDDQKLLCFLEVSRTMSFTKAAENLFLSQSTISRNISILEEETKLILFDRSKKNLILTAAGEIVAAGFEKIAEEYTALIVRAQNAQAGHIGLIRIGILQNFMLDKFPDVLNTFEKDHPEIQVSISTGQISVLRDKLLSGEIDFVLGGQEDLNIIGQPCIKVGNRKIGMAISSNHPLANHKGILQLEDFQDDIFATLPENNAPARKNLLMRCAKIGFVPKIKTAPDLTTLMLWIELNRCISIMYLNPTLVGNSHIRFIEMPQLVPGDASISWCEKNLNQCSRTFISFIQEINWINEDINVKEG